MTEKGPLYGVELIEDLPIGEGSMRQAMPSRSDLTGIAKINQRVVAGYEVLLAHYRESQAEVERLRVLNQRAMAIIADAIVHGMPITEEVSAVRNEIVCGTK